MRYDGGFPADIVLPAIVLAAIVLAAIVLLALFVTRFTGVVCLRVRCGMGGIGGSGGCSRYGGERGPHVGDPSVSESSLVYGGSGTSSCLLPY